MFSFLKALQSISNFFTIHYYFLLHDMDSLCCGKATALSNSPPDTAFVLFYQLKAQRSGFQLERRSRFAREHFAFSRMRNLQGELRRSGGPKWTRFAAAKPRRLQQSTGLLLRAAFRVHFGSLGFTLFSPSGSCSTQQSRRLVGQNGLEPSTSRLSVVCSSQLSYWPILVEISGIEPLTSCLQGRRSPS